MLAKEVVDALYFFAGQRRLLAYCVMPSHLHWVFTPLGGHDKAASNAVEAEAR